MNYEAQTSGILTQLLDMEVMLLSLTSLSFSITFSDLPLRFLINMRALSDRGRTQPWWGLHGLSLTCCVPEPYLVKPLPPPLPFTAVTERGHFWWAVFRDLLHCLQPWSKAGKAGGLQGLPAGFSRLEQLAGSL